MAKRTPLDEWQAGQEYWQLLAADIYRGEGCHKANGQAVIVIPGLFANDLYLLAMRGWLDRIGYRSVASSLAWNVGCPKRLLKELKEPIEKVLDEAGGRVAIVGHSRGGLLGKALASRYSDRVSCLVVIGSPLGGMLRSGREGMAAYADRLAGTPGGKMMYDAGRGFMQALDPDCNSPDCTCDYMDCLFASLPEEVPVTSIYSSSDPIVPPALSHMPYGENHVVDGTHSGLMFNVEVYPHLERALAHGRWSD